VRLQSDVLALETNVGLEAGRAQGLPLRLAAACRSKSNQSPSPLEESGLNHENIYTSVALDPIPVHLVSIGGPFSVKPEQIASLSGSSFGDFINRLLTAEAAAQRLSNSDLVTTYKENVGDGGVDAGLRNAATSRWLPDGESAWQFKAGNLIPSKIAGEIKGAKSAIDVIRRGGSYRLVLGTSLNTKTTKAREDKLREAVADLGIKVPDDKLSVVGAEWLARWAEEYPTLAVSPAIRGAGHVGQPHRQWAASIRHQSQFESSESRDQAIQAIHGVLSAGAEVDLHVHGDGGQGKTRLVLEALRGHELEALVLYISAADEFSTGAMSYLQAHGRAAVMVVDECDARRHEIYASLLTPGTRLRLVSIGLPSAASTRSPMVRLRGLEDEAMSELLRKNSPGLWTEARKVVVDVADGNIDYALKAARAVETSSARSAEAILSASAIRDVIRAELPGGALFLAASALALVPSLGFDQELAGELRSLSSALDIREVDLRAAARELEDAGFLTRHGRLRTVGPHPVALHLAAAAWRDLGDAIVARLIPTLDATLTEGLFRRLSEIGDPDLASEAIDRLMADGGPLGSFARLVESGRAQLLRHLVGLNPEATANKLEGLLGEVPRETLRGARSVRRDLVWALEKLAWHRGTFERAATLLLRLAVAENEEYANNAIGTFVELFGTMLPGTAAKPSQRLSYLAPLASSEDDEVRLLVVSAAAHALVTHESITVSGELQGGVVVEPRGRPSTYGEIWSYRGGMLELLVELTQDDSTDIRTRALSAITSAIHGILHLPELRKRLISLLDGLSEEQLRQVRLEVSRLSALFERVDLDEDDGRPEGLEELAAAIPRPSPDDELWQMLNERPWDWEDEDLAGAIAGAASRVVDASPVESLMAVLFDSEIPAAFEAGRALVRLDQGILDDPRVAVLLESPNSASVFGIVLQAHGEGVVERVLQFIRDQVADPVHRLQLLAALPASDVLRAQVLEAANAVSVADACRTLFRWARELPSAELAAHIDSWIDRAQSQMDYNALVDLVALHLHRVEGTPAPLGASVERLVLARSIYPDVGRESWDWGQLAGRPEVADLSVVRLLADLIESDLIPGFAGSAESNLLRASVAAAGRAGWEELMMRLHVGAWRLQFVCRGWLAGAVPVAVASKWVGDDPARARSLAAVASVGGNHLSDIATLLLSKFPDDERIESDLAGQFMSGSWVGPESARLGRQIEQVESWLATATVEPVRAWARKLKRSLEKQLAQAHRRESEEQARRP
jgi:hypothetical protein